MAVILLHPHPPKKRMTFEREATFQLVDFVCIQLYTTSRAQRLTCET